MGEGQEKQNSLVQQAEIRSPSIFFQQVLQHSFFLAKHKCFEYDFLSFCKKVAIIYLPMRHEICDEEHQIATFLTNIINKETKENEVGRACRYHKCKPKLHKQWQSQQINGQDQSEI